MIIIWKKKMRKNKKFKMFKAEDINNKISDKSNKNNFIIWLK
jgi:hypothetical protein